MSRRLKNNDIRFQSGDVAGRTGYAFMIVFKLSSLCGIADRQIQGTLCNIYTDTDCFLVIGFSFLALPCVMRV